MRRFRPSAVEAKVLAVDDFVKPPPPCVAFAFVGVWTIEMVGLDGLAECCLEAFVGLMRRASLD